MNLAQVTTALGQKDSERTAVNEEIKKLEDLRFQDFTGVLHLNVLHIDGLEGQTTQLDYHLSPEDSFLSKDGLRSRSLGDHIVVYVRTQELELKVDVKSFATAVYPDDAEPVVEGGEDEEKEIVEVLEKSEHKYVASMSITDVPTDTEMRTELVGELRVVTWIITALVVLCTQLNYYFQFQFLYELWF